MWKKILLTGLMGLMLASCTVPDLTGRTIRQGNLLSQAKLQRLKIGMTKEEVSVIMGDSLLSSPLNHDRWDYVDSSLKGGRNIKIKHISLYFSQGRLTNIVKK